MIVTAALVWYDEHPKDLRACVRGVAQIADRIVAVDGAYVRYPNAKISSPPEQAKAIQSAAKRAGLECVIHVPEKLWAGQIEKRSFALAEASKGTDWIAIVDTDWIIHADREAARAELEGYLDDDDVDVVSAPLYTPTRKGATFATNWHRDVAGASEFMPHLIRPLPDLHVETRHWWYSAEKHGRRVWLWHGTENTHIPLLPWYPIKAEYEIEHRFLMRDEEHILAGRAFCNDREIVLAETGQEDDVYGLPPPDFDFKTIPY